jgi:hypothetical protein
VALSPLGLYPSTLASLVSAAWPEPVSSRSAAPPQRRPLQVEARSVCLQPSPKGA